MKVRCLFLLLIPGKVLFPQVNLSSSITACYALNGNANDPINNLNGILSNVTATVDRFNNAGSAYAFNGSTSSFIQLPNNSLLKANQVSFSAWVRFNTLNTAQYIVFTHNGCMNYHEGYMLAVNNWVPGGFRLQMAKSTSNCSAQGQITLNGSTVLSPQVWYHVGFYAGPDSLKLYLNGALETVIANSNALSYNLLSNVLLGGSGQSFNAPLNGSLDNVRFYNRKLNNAEFLALYLQDPACLAIPSGSAPAVAFTVSSVSLCAGNSISLTDLSANNPTNWNWQIPGANPPNSNQQNPVIAFQNPGTYTVSLVASNTVGASNTGTQSIVVLPNPSVSVSGPTSSCSGYTVNLIAGGASTYTWNTSQTGAILNVNPGMTTLYSVTGTDLNGCSNSASLNVVVLASPVISIVSNPVTACQGQSLGLTASGAQTYTWSNFQTGNAIVLNLISNSIYQVTGTDANNCSSTASIAISVLPLPQVLATANKTLVCRGNSVILSATGAQNYVWNAAISGNTIQVNPTFNTIYTVVGTSASGCSNQAVVYIQVSECVGLDDLEQSDDIRVYPNPAQNDLFIHLPINQLTTIVLYDALGQELFKQELVHARDVQVDITRQVPGIYYLNLLVDDQLKTIRFTKVD